MFREMWLNIFGLSRSNGVNGFSGSETGIFKESCDGEQQQTCREMFGERLEEQCGACPFFGPTLTADRSPPLKPPVDGAEDGDDDGGHGDAEE